MRTICVKYMRSLGQGYPSMIADEKLDLCRLMVHQTKFKKLIEKKKERLALYEALQRHWRSVVQNEDATLKAFEILREKDPLERGKGLQLAISMMNEAQVLCYVFFIVFEHVCIVF